MTEVDRDQQILRVCLATHSFPPSSGGLEKLVDGLSQALAHRNHMVTVLAQCDPKLDAPRTEARGSVSVHRFPWIVGRRRFGFSPQLVRWARRHASEFDLFNAFNYHAPVGLGLALSISSPLVISPAYHGEGHTWMARLAHRPYGVVASVMWRRASAVIANSRGEGEALVRDLPIVTSRLRVVPLAVVPVTPSTGPMSHDHPVILFVGRLDRYKSVDVLLRAVAMLNRPLTVVVCGTGPERESLEQLTRSLGVSDRVRFEGFVEENVLWQWRFAAQAVVSLSTHESYGLSLAEGAASGAVVVATDIPAHADVFEHPGVVAEIVPAPPEPSTVAAAINRALDLTRPGAESVVKRTWDDVARDYEGIYREVLQR